MGTFDGVFLVSELSTFGFLSGVGLGLSGVEIFLSFLGVFFGFFRSVAFGSVTTGWVCLGEVGISFSGSTVVDCVSSLSTKLSSVDAFVVDAFVVDAFLDDLFFLGDLFFLDELGISYNFYFAIYY